MTSLNLPIVQQFYCFENENRSYDLLLGLYSNLLNTLFQK